jgi:hypothetical protein
MKSGLSYPARGVLLTGTLIAYGQTPSPTAVAQSPVTAPPSGVLVTQPPAPVAVPPSGVLVTPPTAERRAVTTELFKTGQKERTRAKDRAQHDAPPCRAFAVGRTSQDGYADSSRRSKYSSRTFGG